MGLASTEGVLHLAPQECCHIDTGANCVCVCNQRSKPLRLISTELPSTLLLYLLYLYCSEWTAVFTGSCDVLLFILLL